MSKAVSISFCKGEGSLNHNNRKFKTPNVDPARTSDNIIYKQQPLREAYAECFAAAIEEYDNKQKRSDRKIGGVDGYMTKIKNSKNGEKLFYETLVQIGTKYDCNCRTIDGKKATEVLDEYMKDFQRRNPNLYVFNAVLHLDEETPHLHIDYIPVADGYKQGMMCRNSLDKALKQQGIDGQANKFANSTEAWQKRERAVLVEGIEKIGWEYKAVESDRGDLTLSQYKAMCAEIERAVAELPDEIEAKPVPLSKDKVVVSAADLAALEQRAKLSQVREQAENTVAEKIEQLHTWESSTLGYLEQELKGVRRKGRELDYEIHEAFVERNAAEAERRKYEDAYKMQLDLNGAYKRLYAAYKASKDENAQLQAKVNQAETATKTAVEAAVKPLQAKIKEQESEIEIRVNTAVEAAVKPLQAKIKVLDADLSIVSTALSHLMQLMRYVVAMFAGKISRAFLNAGIKRGEQEMERAHYTNIPQSARVRPEISKDIVLDLRYKKGDEGKGLYDQDDGLVYRVDSIAEAREMFPNCKIKNELEKGLER